MTIKRILCTALAITLAVSCLLFGGCSTPSVAMQVGDKTYEMGDYLAYMFDAIGSDYQIYLYYAYYGYGSDDIASQTFTYGEDSEELLFKDYITQLTQDTVLRQKAIEELMKQYGIEWDADQLATAEEYLAELTTDAYLQLGFNNDRYINMYKAVYLNESSLFTGLYDEGGVQEVSDADERAWFDEHYFSYKIIEISLVDSESSEEFSDDQIAEIKKQMEGYLALYNKSGKNGDAFDVAYRQYLADTTEEDEEDTTVTDEETEEEPETATRNDAIDEDMDEELVKAIKELGLGEIGIKTYQAGGTTKTMALILRMDPEAERGEDEDGNLVDYYVDSHEQTLEYMKYDEMDEMIETKVEELSATVTLNKRAISAADPQEMLQLMIGN